MALKKVILDPKTWDRGGNESGRDVYLLHPTERKMCCMGFAALAEGCPRKAIRGVADWSGIDEEVGDFAKRDKSAVRKLYAINDDEDIPDKKRVALLNKQAKRAKLPFRFVLKGAR